MLSLFVSIIKKIVTLWYGTVRLVRRIEEEKYGTVQCGHLVSTATPYPYPVREFFILKHNPKDNSDVSCQMYFKCTFTLKK